ncbi:GNAT family N-acetyltransferase [Haloglycomyces albus]|uniref:GNAT family N-acetyltransferase n=1 Tax=Haloglycomyces albus TaxID=526067 RepID=UPI00046CA48C|nr:GNAT family N-acetyltransferase [Haloglycomyces albus]
MHNIDIVPLDPTDISHIRGVTELTHSVREHNLSPWPRFPAVMELATRFFTTRYNKKIEYLAVSEQSVVGASHAALSTDDNQHLAMLEVMVHPEYRRQGIGSQLLQVTEKRLQDEGRHTFIASSIEGYPDGEAMDESGLAFAHHHGYHTSLIEVQRRNDLFAVDERELDDLLADAWKHAQDYELIQYYNSAPEDLVEGLCVLHEGMYTDVPLGDTDIREVDFTPERLRARERASLERGVVQPHSVIRHKASKEIAGFSVINVFPGSEDIAYQDDTIVHKTHRGHRLGTILKIANQRELRRIRPQLRYIDTWNAESNEHMIAINEAIGYRKLCREHELQKKLSE